ncbi:MAG: trypsin-like peptidase domain-containing protein [Gemmatimonadales bacterium]
MSQGFARRRGGAVALGLLLAAACTAEPRTDRGGEGIALAATPASAPAAASAPTVRLDQQLDQQLDESRTTAIVRAANRVAPAVVSVNVIQRQAIQPRSTWESFFLPPGAERRSVSFGSGVIVRPDGIIVTNNHVIEGAEQIRVTLQSGADVDAELVGTDALADIAVLRVNGRDLPAAPVGSAADLMIGEWAVAIGNPLGNYVGDTQPTVTAGVVSAVGRNIAPSAGDETFFLGMIQTDAAINPGNSGGPLVNSAGEVIGINASIISRSGGSEGLGFAIPIDRALRIVDDLLRFGEVRRAWVGVDVEPVDADAWGRTRGVRVSSVAQGSPGANAGLRVGDRLLRVNGKSMAGPLDFQGALLDLRAGDRLSLEVEGRRGAVDIDAVPIPSMTAERVRVLEDIELITVTPQVRAERGIRSEEGAMITDITPAMMQQIGLRPGDVIVGINRTPVRSAEEFARAIQSMGGRGQFVLTFERDGGYGVRNLSWGR